MKNHKDNTELFAINTENCPVTLEKMYYLSGLSEDYVLYEEDICKEISSCYIYRNTTIPNDEIVFIQNVKYLYKAHFDNEHDNNLEYMVYDGCDAYFKSHGSYSILVWDDGEYIFEISGNMNKLEMMKLGRTLKIIS